MYNFYHYDKLIFVCFFQCEHDNIGNDYLLHILSHYTNFDEDTLRRATSLQLENLGAAQCDEMAAKYLQNQGTFKSDYQRRWDNGDRLADELTMTLFASRTNQHVCIVHEKGFWTTVQPKNWEDCSIVIAYTDNGYCDTIPTATPMQDTTFMDIEVNNVFPSWLEKKLFDEKEKLSWLCEDTSMEIRRCCDLSPGHPESLAHIFSHRCKCSNAELRKILSTHLNNASKDSENRNTTFMKFFVKTIKNENVPLDGFALIYFVKLFRIHVVVFYPTDETYPSGKSKHSFWSSRTDGSVGPEDIRICQIATNYFVELVEVQMQKDGSYVRKVQNRHLLFEGMCFVFFLLKPIPFFCTFVIIFIAAKETKSSQSEQSTID